MSAITDTGRILRTLSLVVVAAAVALTLLRTGADLPAAEAAGPSVRLDMDIGNGACVDIDENGSAPLAGQVQAAVCLTNPGSVPVAAYSFRVRYDDTKLSAPEVADTGAGNDDNPDANTGTTMFTSATYPNALGGGWDCGGGVGAYPKGDLDGVAGDGDGTVYSGGCSSNAGPNTLTAGPLAVITFDVIALGTHDLTLVFVAVTDDNISELGSCNPGVDLEITCSHGAITAIPGTSTISGKVYGNAATPGNEIEGALVQACAPGCVGATTTDASGAYTIAGLPANTYTVKATAPPTFGIANISVPVGAGQSAPGQHIVVPAIPAGSISGTVYHDSVSPANGLPFSVVQACLMPAGTPCLTDSTDSLGAYQIRLLEDGTYDVTAYPTGLYFPDTLLSVVVSGGDDTPGQDLIAPTIPAPPPGAVEPPIFLPTDPITLTDIGCPGGAATYEMINYGVLIRSGSMTEGPPGTYTANITPLLTGGALITQIDIDCPNPTPDESLLFGLYIDPSGFVNTVEGAPIVGATVQLYRSNSPFGPFLFVPDGHAIMSPANRENPDMTDGTGHFGWDVIAGYYKVRASKFGCTDPLNSAKIYVETAVLTIPPPVFDLDLRLDCGTPVCDLGDPAATNTDGEPIENGPLLANQDITIPKSDTTNDNCETDDDNDGLPDADESTFPVPGCASATATLNWLLLDTDGDALTDGWECGIGSDPANRLSKDTGGTSSVDADTDRIFDLWEMRGYNANSAGPSTDSDGDGCHDMVEVASVTDNKTIDASDRLAVARRALNIWGPEPAQDYALDIDKNGVVGDPDRLFVARASLLLDWLPKSCP